MLGGRISAQDEDDVEDELAALEAEMAPQVNNLPAVLNKIPAQKHKDKEEEERQPEMQAMLAS